MLNRLSFALCLVPLATPALADFSADVGTYSCTRVAGQLHTMDSPQRLKEPVDFTLTVSDQGARITVDDDFGTVSYSKNPEQMPRTMIHFVPADFFQNGYPPEGPKYYFFSSKPSNDGHYLLQETYGYKNDNGYSVEGLYYSECTLR